LLVHDFPSPDTSFSALNATLAALQAASGDITQLDVSDSKNFENNSMVQTFEKAESAIKESFAVFGVSVYHFDTFSSTLSPVAQLSEEWSKKEKDRKEALRRHNDHMHKLNTVLKYVSYPITYKQAELLMVMRSLRVVAARPQIPTSQYPSTPEEVTPHLSALVWVVVHAIDPKFQRHMHASLTLFTE